MKYIITESQSDIAFSNLLKKKNIKYDIVYLNDNGYDSITATVYLYKDGEKLGYNLGYEFFFNYDSRFNRLTPDGHFPKLENNKELFAFMPSEMVIKFFTDKVETYLKKFIDNGYSNLRRK
jgi:hypothetical protein